MLNKEMELRMLEKHEHLQERAITATNMLKKRDELEKDLQKYQGYLNIIKKEHEYYKQARAFLVNHQDEKYQKDSETIKQSMQLASTLVKQKNPITPRFLRKPGLRPESRIVIDRKSKTVPLVLTEGTGVAESISSLTILSVLQSTPFMKTVFFDEMFSSVSQENSESISKMLNPISENLFQMVMIEQKDSVFTHTNYRDFRIEYDGNTSQVTTYDVNDGEHRVVEEVNGNATN